MRSEKFGRDHAVVESAREVTERGEEEVHHWVTGSEHDVVGTSARVLREARIPRHLALVREAV